MKRLSLNTAVLEGEREFVFETSFDKAADLSSSEVVGLSGMSENPGGQVLMCWQA